LLDLNAAFNVVDFFVVFPVAVFFHAMRMFGLRNINNNTEKGENINYPLCGVSCFLPFALLLANTLFHALVSILFLKPCMFSLLRR
jgi:hypothetical protein